MAETRMEEVCEEIMQNRDLVTLILKGLSRRDFDRCRCICWMWNHLCNQITPPGLIVRMRRASQIGETSSLLMCEVSANSECTQLHVPTIQSSSTYTWYEVIASFEDIVLVSAGNKLFVGSPTKYLNKWKLLPDPGFGNYEINACFGRSSEDDSLVAFIKTQAWFRRYCFRKNSWIIVSFPEGWYSIKRCDPVWHGNTLYTCLQEGPYGVTSRVWGYNINDMEWTQLALDNEYAWMLDKEHYLMATNGKIVIYARWYEEDSIAHKILEWDGNKFSVQEPWWCAVRNAGSLRKPILKVFCKGDTFFFVNLDDSVVRYSRVDNTCQELGPRHAYTSNSSHFYHAGDGNAFSTFHSLPWYEDGNQASCCKRSGRSVRLSHSKRQC